MEYIINKFSKEEKGVRRLKYALEQIILKLNMLRYFRTSITMPYKIKDFEIPYNVTIGTVDELYKNTENKEDIFITGMYC